MWLSRSEVALTSAPIVHNHSLYEWAGGQLQLVSVLPGPGGEPAANAELGAYGC